MDKNKAEQIAEKVFEMASSIAESNRQRGLWGKELAQDYWNEALRLKAELVTLLTQ